MQKRIKNAFQDARNVLTEFINKDNINIMGEISENLAKCFNNQGKILICGNGGSNCDAVHFAEEFTGRYRNDRKPLPVISLSDSSHITCVGNDYGFEEIFARAVRAYGFKGDILIAISTSGNSPNISKAISMAQELDMLTVGLLGKDGGKIKGMCDHELIVQGETTDRIQEVHMTILHILIEMTERLLFPRNYE